MKRKTPLRRASKKRARELVAYNRLRHLFLAKHLYCEMPSRTATVSCMNPATEIHHSHGRGKLLNETKFWYALCQTCHRWIHDHPNLAREKGLLK